MGNCGSGNLTEEEKLARKRSRDIDSALKHHGRVIKDEIKILLLGPGESGKSTIFKQMKIIQLDGGYSTDELEEFRPIVYANILSQMRVLIENLEGLDDVDLPAELEAEADMIMDAEDPQDTFPDKYTASIEKLWKSNAIQAVYKKRDSHFQLNDSAQYFFDAVTRIGAPDYIPSQDDVLRARVRSTGIEEADFKFEDISFRMFDVGGQRSERRKWIHCFDAVTAVLFCVSLSGYDQMLREDESQNRMKEALLLFDEICNSPWFRDTSFILFLNKKDLFETKVKEVPLTVCFPNYSGGDNYEAACGFIEARFLEQNQAPHKIYVHFTCAIDTQNIEKIFAVVRKTLLENTMRETGIY